MDWNVMFFVNSALLGIGLAMDAFSVSLANGLNEPCMKNKKVLGIAGVFAGFQALMPLLGWLCVHMLLQYFKLFEPFIPWIALILLCYIGSKMLLDGIRTRDCACEQKQAVGLGALLVQGIATSIDALSVGFTIAEYNGIMALVCALIIAAVTFMLCTAGILIGKKFGTVFSNNASVLGGVILIAIGFEILISSFF